MASVKKNNKVVQEENEKFLNQLEEEFINRFSKRDVEYLTHCKYAKMLEVPILPKFKFNNRYRNNRRFRHK